MWFPWAVALSPSTTPNLDAAFSRAEVLGLTNIVAGTNGFALVDLNKDGLMDMVLCQQPVSRSTVEFGPEFTKLNETRIYVMVATGPMTYREHKITIRNQKQVRFGERQAGQIPNLADFNKDGYLDLFLTRSSASSANRPIQGAEPLGNSLYLSDGAWDKFVDVSDAAGIRNEMGYNRQSSIGDVNKDGWLDIAIGCDNIGNAMGGVPHSRLFVFKPNGSKFTDGKFEDIGGTDLIPDFGGFYHDSKKDKAGPDVTLRDLDDDGDLDVLQDFHIDIRDPNLPFSPGEYRQGNFNWKNLVDRGAFKFEKVTENGFANEGKLKWNQATKRFDIEYGKAPGLPYVTTADIDNDGDQDILAVGPSDSSWSPRTEYVGGRYWRNEGGFKFAEQTNAIGLESLNWTYRRWLPHFGMSLPTALVNRPAMGVFAQTSGLPRVNPLDWRPYYADAIFGDVNNDGWIDLVVLDRREGAQGLVAHAILYLNNKGKFELQPMATSGIDFTSIAGEMADLNNDGLLDLVIAADPDNTGGAAAAERYQSKVFVNMGANGAKENQWLRLRFSEISQAELIGAKVTVREPGANLTLGTRWIHSDHSYKSSGALDAHFGLGKVNKVDIEVVLPSRQRISIKSVSTSQFLDINMKTSKSSPVLAR
jgi:hypothetical protein